MLYQGFGYSGYQYPADNHNTNPYSTGRNPSNQPPAAVPTSNSHNAGREYQQSYGWQGTSLPNTQQSTTSTTAARNDYWMNSSSQQTHGRSYAQQPQQQQQQPMSYRDTSTLQPNTGQQTRNNSFDFSTARRNVSSNLSHTDFAPPDTTSRARVTPYYQHKPTTQELPISTAAPSDSGYQYEYNRLPMEPSANPASSQAARDAAASAMTALSTSVPSRYQQYSSKHTSSSNISSSVSASNPTPPSSSPAMPAFARQQATQNRSNRSPNMATAAPRGRSTATAQQHYQQHEQRQPQVQSQEPAQPQPPSSNQSAPSSLFPPSKQLPVPVATRAPLGTPSNDSAPSNFTSENRNTSQAPQPTTPLPSFVDPTQIYNPYHLEVKAAQEAAEAEARKNKQAEIEAEAARRREEEAKKQREEQDRAEAEVRRHLEAMEQASYASGRSERNQSSHNINNPSTEQSVEAETPDPVAKPAQKRKGGRPRKSEHLPMDSQQKTAAKKATQKRKSAPGPAAAENTLNMTPNPTEGDEDMVSGMMTIMEQMRKWKSKDPALFSKLLEDLKKPSKDGRNRAASAAASSTPTPAAPAPPPSSTVNAQAPAATSDELPDLGRFPYQRRRRGPYKKRTTDPQQDLQSSIAPETPTRQPGPAKQNQTPGLGKFPAARCPARSAGPIVTPLSVPPSADLAANNAPSELPAEIPPTTETAIPEEAPQQPANPPPEQSQSQTQNTLWPDSLRIALADAACGYINDLEGNKSRGKKCEPPVILGFIERNPSYIDLCGLIEAEEFHINRVHFAKNLLQKVPGLAGGNSQPSQSAPPPAPTEPAIAPPAQPFQPPHARPVQSGRIPLPPPQPSPGRRTSDISIQATSPQTSNLKSGRIQLSQPAPPHASNKASIKWTTPSAPGARRRTVSQTPTPSSGSKLGSKLHVQAPPAHVPAPGSKEAQARKRNFSDIVDLTQAMSDDEDFDPPSKQARLDTSPPAQADTQPQPATEPQVPSYPHPQQLQSPVPQQPQTEAVKSMDLARFKHTSSPSGKQEALRRRSDLVKPINKAEALRKSYYDPRTIARDILIASGRHPTERPLNWHLFKLREKFDAVDNGSDLGTFRWDLVDPGGPPRPEVEKVPLMMRPPQPRLPNNNAPNHVTSQTTNAPNSSKLHVQFQPVNARSAQTQNSVHLSSSVPSPSSSMTTPSAPEGPPAPRRRGRRPGSLNKSTLLARAQANRRLEVVVPGTVNAPVPRPLHGLYQCGWLDCDAKLHNLDVLRTHLLKNHILGASSCKWAGCSARGTLRDHMEAHLSEVAWERGEGPKTKRAGEIGDNQNTPILVA